MKCNKKILFTVLCLCLSISLASAQETTERHFPVPQTVSPEMQDLIAAPPPAFWNLHPRNAQEWKSFSKEFADAVTQGLPQLCEKMGVTVSLGRMGNVPIFTVTPKTVPAANADRVLLHFHGGGYVLGAA